MPYETTAWAGPLTMIWPDGQHCVQTYTSAAGKGWAAIYSVFFGHWGSYEAARTCYPPAVAGTAVDVGSNYYFSPGVCPSGYATACAYTGHTNIPDIVTASVCCPRYVRPSRSDCHQIRLEGGRSNCRPNNTVDSAASTDGQCKCLKESTLELTARSLSDTTESSVCKSMLGGQPLSNVHMLSDPTLLPGLRTITPASGDNVWGNGIPVMWESTDTDVLSLFGYQVGGATTLSDPTLAATNSNEPAMSTSAPDPGRTTRSPSSRFLLTGSCSLPSWTLVDLSTAASVIALIGCGWDRTECCPFAAGARTDSATPPFPTPRDGPVALIQCPKNYQPESSGCCPLCVVVPSNPQASNGVLRERGLLTKTPYSGFHETALGTQIKCDSPVTTHFPTPTLPANSDNAANPTKPTGYIVNYVYAEYIILSPSSNGSESNSLSTGAKIGIGVGASVAALLIAGLAYLLVRMCIRSTREQREQRELKRLQKAKLASMSKAQKMGRLR